MSEDEPARAPVVDPAGEPGGQPVGEPVGERRPLLERIGMAAIALVMAALFGLVAAAAWVSGEVFLGAMGAIGCFMTLWVGAITLLRG